MAWNYVQLDSAWAASSAAMPAGLNQVASLPADLRQVSATDLDKLQDLFHLGGELIRLEKARRADMDRDGLSQTLQ